MSLALLKKSIDIVEEDLAETANREVSKKSVNRSKPVKKRKEISEYSGLQEKRKCSIRDAQNSMQTNKNNLEKNVFKLLALSKTGMKIDAAEKIIKRAVKGRTVDIEVKPVKNQESIFTEEDFQNFEKEYFNT